MRKGTHFTEEQLKQLRESKKTSEHLQNCIEKLNKKIVEYFKNPDICKCGCGNIIPYKLRGRKYSKGHYNKSGTNNPNYGKKASEETRKLISLAQIGKKYWLRDIENYPEARQKLSEAMSRNNPSSNPEINRKMLETKKIRGSSITGGIKAAETARRNGTKAGGRCKWIQVGDKKVQGTFELKFVQFLDEIGIDWISHKGIETFKYVGLDGKDRTYQPDIRDENGIYYDPHAKYYWNAEYQHKIDEVKRNNPDKVFVCFHEDEFESICASIKDKIWL